MNGKLLIVDSEEKMDQLAEIIEENDKHTYKYWLGVVNSDWDFQWPDGINLTYTNWADYQPRYDDRKKCTALEKTRNLHRCDIEQMRQEAVAYAHRETSRISCSRLPQRNQELLFQVPNKNNKHAPL